MLYGLNVLDPYTSVLHRESIAGIGWGVGVGGYSNILLQHIRPQVRTGELSSCALAIYGQGLEKRERNDFHN